VGKSPKELSAVEHGFLNRCSATAAQEFAVENFMCSGFGGVLNENEHFHYYPTNCNSFLKDYMQLSKSVRR
jgi:hypothetical protein